ncbi:MAG TPA: TlpA disulfide reductase family protein [Lacipirellula sp.]
MTRRSLSLVRRFFITLVALAVIAPAMLTQRPLVAQEEGADEQAAAAPDLSKIPQGDAKALHAYIEKVATTPPPEDASEEEQVAFAKKSLSSLVTAANRLLEANPSDEQAVDAHGYRIQALQALVALGVEKAQAQYEKALAEARSAKQPRIVGLGWQTYIQDRVQQWDQLDEQAKQAFRDEIIKKVKAEGPQPIDVSIVHTTALQLDGADDEFVVNLLKQAGDLFAKSEDADVKEALAEANFDGMLRRLTLLGNEMEISGELLSGGKVDWESFSKDKVVLVDFWATWCGPCRAEIPNVLDMYEKYHDKGFEVLGVSLDRTPEDAKKYVAQNKLPWDSLFPSNEEERFWNHPLVEYYGISGIPTAILVGKDGKVVHMNARDENLREALQRLLGDPVEKPQAEKAEAEKAAAAS